MKRKFVTGLFKSDEEATQAVENLIEAEFTPSEIGVLKAQGDEGELVEVELQHKTGVPVGAAVGGALGGALGAAGAGLAAVGVLAAPPLGLLAAGPIVAALEGALVGGAGGSFVGTLAGLGFWKKEADIPERLGEGAVLVGVPASEERREEARRALERAGAEQVEVGQ